MIRDKNVDITSKQDKLAHFGIMASNSQIELPEKTRIDVTLKKEEEK
jgi:hypothetical protein